MKKSLKLLVDNNDPRYLREKLRGAFPELSAGDKFGAEIGRASCRERV